MSSFSTKILFIRRSHDCNKRAITSAKGGWRLRLVQQRTSFFYFYNIILSTPSSMISHCESTQQYIRPLKLFVWLSRFHSFFQFPPEAGLCFLLTNLWREKTRFCSSVTRSQTIADLLFFGSVNFLVRNLLFFSFICKYGSFIFIFISALSSELRVIRLSE